MLATILGFVVVGGVIAGVAFVTRSFVATLLASLALSVLVLTSLFVQVASDVGSILDYLSDPKVPVLAVISDGERTVAAFRVKPQSIHERQQLMKELQSTDPQIHDRALAEVKRRFWPDMRDDYRGPLPASVVRAMVTDVVESVDGPKLAELVSATQQGDWTPASKGFFRVVRLDVTGARRILASQPTVQIPLHVGDARYQARFKTPFILDCIDASDCRARLAAAVHDPTLALAQVDDNPDVLRALDMSDEKQKTFDQMVEYLPPGGFANGIAAALAFYMAGQAASAAGPAAIQSALDPQPIEMFPKTPLARLLDRAASLAVRGPQAALVRRGIAKLTVPDG